MPAFPESPISAQEFFEKFVPSAFADVEVPEASRSVDVKFGVLLHGEGGGEWLMRFEGGELSVEPGSRTDALLSLLTSVDDWRGALWEGRGGVVGRAAAGLLRAGPGAANTAAQAAPPPNQAALDQLQSLDGVIKVVVTGGDGGDWAVALKIGAGAIPEEPTTTVSVSAEDADAMASGDLDPMQAFMGGKVLITGDMAFVMQMGAIASMAGQGSPEEP